MSRKGTTWTLVLFALAIMLSGEARGENGRDFIKEARLIFVAAACGDGQIPDGIEAVVVESHCREVRPFIVKARKDFVDKVRSFLALLLPKDLPTEVVYPFGGGDLLTALATYTDARVITTISLESAGDPQRLGKASASELRDALKTFRTMQVYLLKTHDNRTENLPPFERGVIPGQLAFSLAAAVVFGYEPLSLRYFRIEQNGALHYLTQAEISALEQVKSKKLASFMPDPDFSPAFRNMELVLRRIGSGAGPELIIHRHIAANLSNRHFEGSLLKTHLESKGKIAAMTKAGGYLLWRDDFSSFRGYLLAHMTFMISDSTGILPRHAAAAGFEQTTFGAFHGAFLEDNGGEDAAELRRLWNEQPFRPLPFRYGYSDIRGANHLMVTRPKAAGR
ncbi:MAG TPA: hypothetical protein VEI57_11685 [Nitrospirota bacterium]|nr:hypothetical protein [Nitrospirota bacterium]